MRIKSVRIKNFRSLRNLVMDDIGDLTILIGPNSSGKSNIVEALFLFFNELDAAPQRNIGPVNDYLWFDRDSDNDIELTVTIELTDEELGEIVTEDLTKKYELGEMGKKLTITREITGTPGAAIWKTKLVTLNDSLLMEEVDTSMPAEALVPPEMSTAILQNVHQKFKGTFKLIYAARNVTPTLGRLGDRIPFVDPTTIGDLSRLSQSLQPSDERKWIEVMRRIQEASPNIRDMRIMGGILTIQEEASGRYFPIYLIGGGHQEISSLIYQIFKEQDRIFGIEEPELHLHPQLARQLFNILKIIAEETQIFVVTHSTTFVDQVDLSNTWIVRKRENETEVKRVEEAKQLESILWELGIRPSDIFYADAVVFVEGPTEKSVFPILAQSMGVNFRRPGISFVPTYGKSSGRYHLNVWTKAAGNVRIPYFMILDKDARTEAKKLEKEGILRENENLFILQQGSIEEYYPDGKLVQALKSEYKLEMSDAEEKEILKGPRCNKIQTFLKTKLGKHPSGWKVVIGQKVAESLSEDEIHEDLKSIIERIARKMHT